MKRIILFSAIIASLLMQTVVTEAAHRHPGHKKHGKGMKHKARKKKDPAYQ